MSFSSSLLSLHHEQGWILSSAFLLIHHDNYFSLYSVSIIYHNNWFFLKLNQFYITEIIPTWSWWIGLPTWLSGKEFVCQCRRHQRHRFDPWVRKIPWRRKWQPTPVFLAEESCEQRSLAGCSPWDCKESDTTEHACWIIFFNMLLDSIW